MALSDETQRAVKSLIELLESNRERIENPIPISPKLMRMLILTSQQRMTVGMSDGTSVMLYEEDNAPELANAVEAACSEAKPVAP